MSESQSDAPPPYPGTSSSAYSTTSAYPPPNPSFPQPYDPSKAPQYPAAYGPPGYPSGYSQPFSGQVAGHNTQGGTVIVSQPMVTVLQTFRESPVRCTCPHCQAEVVTGIHFETGNLTWIICCVLWWVGCGLGCCLIPFCVDGCKDVIHTCPNCHQQIARYNRM